MQSSAVTRSKPMMGTFVEISVNSRSRSVAFQAIAGAFDVMTNCEHKLSRFIETSDISRINRACAGEKILLHSVTEEILELAKTILDASEGLFDPACSVINNGSSLRDLAIVNHHAVIEKPIEIDLGGIAKGFIVDKGFEFLADLGFAEIRVAAGGDLRCRSEKPSPLLTRNPKNPAELLEIGCAQEYACATSADYYRSITLHDRGLYDPREGPSNYKGKSVSIISPACAVSDALTKVISLASGRTDLILKNFNAYAVELVGGHL